MGIENGLKESLAVVRNHFSDHFKHNGFGWIVVNWEISLVKQYKPEVTATMTTWLPNYHLNLCAPALKKNPLYCRI
jgi:hypothetical protein